MLPAELSRLMDTNFALHELRNVLLALVSFEKLLTRRQIMEEKLNGFRVETSFDDHNNSSDDTCT